MLLRLLGMNNHIQPPLKGRCSVNPLRGILLFVLLGQAIPAFGQDDFVIDAAAAEAWVFQNHGDRPQAEKAIAAQLEISITQINRKFSLTSEQEQTLRLAASGDIKRFFDSADLVIKKISGLKVGQNEFNDAWQLTIPIQQKMRQGLFADNSLFQKVLYNILEPAQSEALIEAEKELLARKLKALVNASIAQIEFSIPLTSTQRNKLSGLLIDKLKDVSLDHEYVQYLILLRLAQFDK